MLEHEGDDGLVDLGEGGGVEAVALVFEGDLEVVGSVEFFELESAGGFALFEVVFGARGVEVEECADGGGGQGLEVFGDEFVLANDGAVEGVDIEDHGALSVAASDDDGVEVAGSDVEGGGAEFFLHKGVQYGVFFGFEG